MIHVFFPLQLARKLSGACTFFHSIKNLAALSICRAVSRLVVIDGIYYLFELFMAVEFSCAAT